MLTINLNKYEYEYILQSYIFKKNYLDILSPPNQNENNYSLKISEDQADDLRDLLGEQLQLAGFDEKYLLTREGEILESLIDKLFVK